MHSYMKLLVTVFILFVFSVGCREFDYFSFNISDSVFSQAPGTQIILSCHMYSTVNTYSDVVITCESDGRWSPDPESSLCAIGR